MSLPNFIIYLLFLGYLLAAWRIFRNPSETQAYRSFLMAMIPAGLLVILGMTAGARPLPQHRLVIHGYRVPLPEKGIYVGSDVLSDPIRIHHRSQDREWFSPGILRIQPSDNGSLKLHQSDVRSPNVISINGRPLRALKLSADGPQSITFGALNHRQSEDSVLTVQITGNRPVFTFRGKTYRKGFVREGFGGLIARPYPEGVLRHLAIGQRLPLSGLPVATSELLGQAAVLRYQGDWWLAANDADIYLDGKPFPNQATVASGTEIRLQSRQLGTGQTSYSFRVSRVSGQNEYLFLAIDPEERPVFPLPRGSLEHNDRICLTANESHFSDTVDILNPQFPGAGMVIHREGDGFVFRGEILKLDRLYSAGKGVFSIDSLHRERFWAMAAFALLFLLSFLFIPPKLVQKEPLMGVVLSGAMLLLAFRQVLAFRAWQGPPFKTSVFFDSLIAPALFTLLVLALTTRFEGGELARRIWRKFHNFLRPRHRLPITAMPRQKNGYQLLGLAGYTMVIYSILPNKLGVQFPLLVLGTLILAGAIHAFSFLEARLSLHAASAPGTRRWQPLFWLMALFAGLMVLAPIFGSREVIAVLPGRPRPDIFIQVFLIFTAAYFASIWEREASRRVPRPWLIILTFAVILVVPLLQGTISRDLGFFLMAAPPLILVLILASWHLDARLRVLIGCVGAGFLAGIWFIKMAYLNLDLLPMRRVAFFIDPQRLKAEYFFDYLAHLPILWVGDQGLFGGGFFKGDWYSALSETSVNDNVASVFIQGELGGIGSVLTMAVFLVMAWSILVFLAQNRQASGYRVWFLLALILTMVWTSATMFLANLGVFPLTGKNLPFLGIDSLNDVVRYGLLFGFGLRYMYAIREA